MHFLKVAKFYTRTPITLNIQIAKLNFAGTNISQVNIQYTATPILRMRLYDVG